MPGRARDDARGKAICRAQQSFRYGRVLLAGLCAAALGGFSSACSDHARPAAELEAEQQLGRMHLALVTPEQDAIRLRTAQFDIRRSDQVVASLDSESDPGATSLDLDLLQGNYEILLHDGWQLERLGDAGAAELLSGALLTANPLPFEVRNARVTDLVYSFTTEQGVVTFGRGSASVSIAVAPNAPTANCNVLDRLSCPEGQTCLFAGDSGRTFCAQPGSLPIGQPCSTEQCVAGAQCLALDPAKPEERTCSEFCNPESLSCGCQSLAGDPSVGVCTLPRPPGILFSHAFRPGGAQTSCNEWSQFQQQLGNGEFERVTLRGSRGGTFECAEPTQATSICRAIRNGNFSITNCNGHQWTTNNCSSNELAVDLSTCGCSNPGNLIRACAGAQFGGVGTDSCAGTPQTIEVNCEPRTFLCGNGVIDSGEACDTNGTAVDILPPNTPAGASCNATCTRIVFDTNPGGCLSCARSNCSTPFENAIGTDSDATNTADVTQLFDCVIGPNWEAGGAIPASSCFFADPAQPRGSLVPCYCGSTPQTRCLATGPANHLESCGVQVETASRCSPVTASCVTSSGSNTAVPLGDALQLLNCERAACAAECGFPPPVDE